MKNQPITPDKLSVEKIIVDYFTAKMYTKETGSYKEMGAIFGEAECAEAIIEHYRKAIRQAMKTKDT